MVIGRIPVAGEHPLALAAWIFAHADEGTTTAAIACHWHHDPPAAGSEGFPDAPRASPRRPADPGPGWRGQTRKMGFPFRCRKMTTCRRQRAGTTLAPTRSCVGGSTRTGSAWTTSIGCAGPMASFAPAVAATTAGGHRICVGAAPAVTARLGDGGHHLRQDAHAADRVVRRSLATGQQP